VLLFWIETTFVIALANGPAGRVMAGGVTMTAGWTLATRVTEMMGVLVHEVFSVIWP
jgi:hypothetical protein